MADIDLGRIDRGIEAWKRTGYGIDPNQIAFRHYDTDCECLRCRPGLHPIEETAVPFALGPRYTSEDMYRDYPDLMPGSRVAVERNGILYTDTVQSVTYHSAEPAIWPHLPIWRRILRGLTPRRFRKPLKPIRAARPATATVQTGPVADDVKARYERHIASLQQAGEIIDGLIRSKPDQ